DVLGSDRTLAGRVVARSLDLASVLLLDQAYDFGNVIRRLERPPTIERKPISQPKPTTNEIPPRETQRATSIPHLVQATQRPQASIRPRRVNPIGLPPPAPPAESRIDEIAGFDHLADPPRRAAVAGRDAVKVGAGGLVHTSIIRRPKTVSIAPH